MTRELNARGLACCVNTVAKVMRQAGIRAKTTRRFVRTTDSNHRLPVSANVLDRPFTATAPNEKWAMDATVTSRLMVDALVMAVGRRGVVAEGIAHSDRGSPYASDHFQADLRQHEMVESMSGVGPCWDNVVVESTFGRLKVELVHSQSYATRDEAKASIFEYIELFYNRVRRHSTLEYMTPDEFERTHNPDSR